jgi:predicted nuclease of predicted toxin-antitoxin system
VKFFFDNNLAAKIAHGLNEMVEPEHQVFHLRDKFPPNIEDADWMKALAAEARWVIVTADVRISRNPHELQAWKEAEHTIFFLKPGWTDLTFWEQANKFTKCFPQILKEAERAERGTAFLVHTNGKIDRLT